MIKVSKYSVHTRLGWGLGVLSIFFGVGIGLTYLLPAEDRTFGIITVIEGVFALVGLVFIDVIYGKKAHLKPDFFKPSETATIIRMIYTLGVLSLFQIAIMRMPLTVRTWHRALAIMFAGPSEELFFRGLLLAPFILYSRNTTKLKIKNPIQKGKYLLEITPLELGGITFSSFAFMMLHINYYGDRLLLITVFGCGIILGLFYLKDKDLTANILAHFLLNFIFVWRSYWIIQF